MAKITLIITAHLRLRREKSSCIVNSFYKHHDEADEERQLQDSSHFCLCEVLEPQESVIFSLLAN